MANIPSRRSKEIDQEYFLQNNTLVRDVKENPKDRIQIEIGDFKQPDFKPQAKIMRWDNEVNFSLRAEEHPNAEVKTEGKVIKYITPDYEVHQYEVDPSALGEDGGLEFEWVLPKKPASNTLRATIQTKGLDFFYQPALTLEEINAEDIRPEKVVGSYAVFHKTKGGINDTRGRDYRVGKAFHIYRPKVRGANGSEAWAELNIDLTKGELTVTIDQNFLDNAVYPVIVDPTFGYTSVGASERSQPVNHVESSLFTSPSDVDTVSSVTYYAGDAFWDPETKGLIFLHSTLALVTNGVGTQANAHTDGDWVTSSFSTPPSLTASTEYLLGMIHNGTACGFFYDTGDANQSHQDSANDYTTPEDINVGSLSHSNRKYSIYATYTVGGTTAVKDLIMGSGIIPFPR